MKLHNTEFFKSWNTNLFNYLSLKLGCLFSSQQLNTYRALQECQKCHMV
jgi:hypothetical protein